MENHGVLFFYLSCSDFCFLTVSEASLIYIEVPRLQGCCSVNIVMLELVMPFVQQVTWFAMGSARFSGAWLIFWKPIAGLSKWYYGFVILDFIRVMHDGAECCNIWACWILLTARVLSHSKRNMHRYRHTIINRKDGFCNRGSVCILWNRNWIFKCFDEVQVSKILFYNAK